MRTTPQLTKRLEIRLSDESRARIDRLRERTDAVSDAEVIRHALKVYEAQVFAAEPAIAADPWSTL